MTTKYLNFSVSIHGLNIKDEDFDTAVDFLVGWIRAKTTAGICGNNHKLFNYRGTFPEFESDIEVELEESAGSGGKAAK